jgi:hypothetical protein
MRSPIQDKPSFVEATGPTGSDLLDVIPTDSRVPAGNRFRGWSQLAARLLGALSVLATGAVHLHEFNGLYSQIPTIGTLFFLNFVGATAIGLCLLAPVERISPRYGSPLLVLSAAAGIALAAVAFAFLAVSQHTPLFGFREPGYDPTGVTAARAAEVAAVLFLGAFLIGRRGREAPTPRW